MMSSFRVSVIIPVYNAEKYIRQAVLSCLQQPEVGEVILVEDGSTDSSFEVCHRICREFENVKLYVHPGNKNMGAGSSRNLGIQNCRFDFISFLDADDFYLENRFSEEKRIFESPEIDGVYAATGILFESEDVRQNWIRYRNNNQLTTITKPLTGEGLFKNLLWGGYGHFTTDAIVVRKKVFEKTGLFSDHRVSQDTNMWIKMSMVSNLVPGSIEKEIAIRRVHQANRSVSREMNEGKFLKPVIREILLWSVSKREIKYDYWNNVFLSNYALNKKQSPSQLLFWLSLIYKKPHLLFQKHMLRKLIQLIK